MLDSTIVASSAIGVLTVGFIILMVIIASVGLIATILKIIALWRLFEKAGEKGWKALIPIYDLYILTKLCWDTKYFWVLLVASLASGFISSFDVNGEQVGLFSVMVALCVGVYSIFYTVFLYVREARSYGKGEGFAIGLVFLNTIFSCILAFGKSKYIGPAGVPVKVAKTTKKVGTKKAKSKK